MVLAVAHPWASASFYKGGVSLFFSRVKFFFTAGGVGRVGGAVVAVCVCVPYTHGARPRCATFKQVHALARSLARRSPISIWEGWEDGTPPPHREIVVKV